MRLRYVALPPDPETGVVNMRLKRNVALLLCTGRVAIFFDDDDWRSPESVQTQLDAMSHHRAHACAWQVHHVCEIDARTRAVRYFDTPDGGGIFSRRISLLECASTSSLAHFTTAADGRVVTPLQRNWRRPERR